MKYKVYYMTNTLEANASVDREAFICFNTQEDRAFNALLNLAKKGRIKDTLILSFASNNSPLSIDFRTYNVTVVDFKIDDDLNCNMIPCLKSINEYVTDKKVIGIDISCMPIPFVAQILRFISEYHPKKSIKIYYTEPSHYNLQALFDYSAYRGEIALDVIRGFEGETSQSGEGKRVIFYLMGFEKDYLDRLIPQDIPPDVIAPINGFPSYFPKYKDISLINEGTDFHEDGIDIIYAEANNPFDVYNTISSLENKYSNYHIDIIPAGTKPMALGACLYALKNVNNIRCRIIFPFPSDYKPKQSKGCGKLWEYHL